MDLTIVAFGAACISLIVFFAARAMARQPAESEPDAPSRAGLTIERDGVLAALQELEADQGTGKVTIDDYARQRADLMRRGADILRRLDEAESPVPVAAPPVHVVAASLSDDPWEAAIAARRRVTPELSSVNGAISAHAHGAESVNGAAPAHGAGHIVIDDDALERAIHSHRRPPVAAQARGGAVASSDCGSAAEAGDRFCSSCGRALPQPRACAHCSEPAEPDDRFCGRCGSRLPEGA